MLRISPPPPFARDARCRGAKPPKSLNPCKLPELRSVDQANSFRGSSLLGSIKLICQIGIDIITGKLITLCHVLQNHVRTVK
jgi:hypothetical protein